MFFFLFFSFLGFSDETSLQRTALVHFISLYVIVQYVGPVRLRFHGIRTSVSFPYSY